MFCCTLLYVHSSIAIILMWKRELVALLNLSSWCLVMVERLFLVVPRGCLRFVIVVFPDHTHLLFLKGSPLKAGERPATASICVTMQNRWNNRISDGCVYAQIRKGLGMHLVTYSNHDTVPFLLIVPIKGRFV